MQGAAATRAALALVALVLLALAGAHFRLLGAPSWDQGASSWAAGLEARAASLRAWLSPGGGATAVNRAAWASRGQGQPLHATLELPDHTVLEIGEHTMVEDVVQRLLASQAGGHRPAAIEIVAVEGGTLGQLAPLRAAADSLSRVLRLPRPWRQGQQQQQGGPATATPASVGTGDDMAGRLGAIGLPSPSGAATAAAQPSKDEYWARLSAAQWAADVNSGREEEGEEEQRLPVAAFDDAYLDDVDEMELPGRHLLQQARQAAGEAAQQEPGEEQDWQPVKLFGPRTPALQLGQAGDQEDWRQRQAEPEPVLRVRLVVRFADEPAGQGSRGVGGEASEAAAIASTLLDRLAGPAAGGGLSATPAALLGRKGAAGGGPGAATAVLLRVRVTEEGSEQPWQRQPGPGWTLLLVAVDSAFVAASAVAVACAWLLARDVARHGLWRPAAGAQRRGDWGEEEQAQAPFIVVAAHEAKAWAAAGKR